MPGLSQRMSQSRHSKPKEINSHDTENTDNDQVQSHGHDYSLEIFLHECRAPPVQKSSRHRIISRNIAPSSDISVIVLYRGCNISGSLTRSCLPSVLLLLIPVQVHSLSTDSTPAFSSFPWLFWPGCDSCTL